MWEVASSKDTTTLQVLRPIADSTLKTALPEQTLNPLVVDQDPGQVSNSSIKHNQAYEESNTSITTVSTPIQIENLLEQGYSTKDIAKELNLDKRQVRQVKRKLKKEEKTVRKRRKKENRIKDK